MKNFKQSATTKLYAIADAFRLSLHTIFMITFVIIYCQSAALGQGQTYGMYDVPVHYDAGSVPRGILASFEAKRKVVIHKKVKFVFDTQVERVSPEVGQDLLDVFGTSFEYTYTTGGKKKVLVKKTASDQKFTFEIDIKEPQAGVNYNSPDAIWHVTHTESYTPVCEAAAYPDRSERPIAGMADAYIKYGAGHNGKLVRPIILVDGIDFDTDQYTDPTASNQVIRHGSTGWDILSMGMEDSKLDEPENGVNDYETFGYYPTTFKTLTAISAANGNDSYDIIFLDFSNGTDYIQRNSLLLIELLKRVNATKVADRNGIVHKNVVIGASMGGQIARIALSMMEQRGIDHCTHTYVSFDSPHKGANIPLSVQAMGWFLSQSSVSELKLDLKDFWKKLKQPAPRQLLFQHFGAEVNNGNLEINAPDWAPFQYVNIPEDFQCLRTQYVADLKKYGYPKNTRNIAISDGSVLCATVNQGYEKGSELIDAHFSVPGPAGGIVAQIQLYGGVGQLDYNSSSYIRTLCPFGQSSTPYVMRDISYNLREDVIFAAALPANQGFGALTCQYEAIVVQANNPNMPQFDNVAGCVRKDLATVKDVLSAVPFSTIQQSTYRRRTAFMPTMSTLDLDWDLNNANTIRNIDKFTILQDKLSPFADFYAPGSQSGDNSANLKHVELTQKMVEWLQEQLITGATAGAATVPLPNATTQQLVFNTDGVIGNSYSVNQNGAIALKGLSTVKVTMGGCAKVDVNINNGGRFDIGSATQVGQVTQTTVGQVTVGSNSILKIANGGNLNLTDNSQLIIETGGKLVIEGGANINLTGSESTIYVKNGGELVINGDMIFSGDGFFQFDQGNVLTLNTDLVLNGSGRTKRMIRLNTPPQFMTNNLTVTGRGFTLSNAIVEYGNRCQINVTNGNNVNTISNVSFRAAPFGGGNSTALNFGNITNANIQNCDFRGLSQGIRINSDANLLQTVDIGNSNFNLVNNGISIVSPTSGTIPANRNLLIHDCTFNYFVDGIVLGSGTACTFQNLMNRVNFDRNTLRGYQEGGLWENITGIELKNTSIRVNGGLISNFKLGISAEKDVNNNISFAGSELSNCEVGVRMIGGSSSIYSNLQYGSVEMRCTRLINNGIAGIQGTDIELYLTDERGGNNTFQNSINGLLFDICYTTASYNIEATHNLWIGGFSKMRFRLRTGLVCARGVPRRLQHCSELRQNIAINCNTRPPTCCFRSVVTSDGNGGVIKNDPIFCLLSNSSTSPQTTAANKLASLTDTDLEKELGKQKDVKFMLSPNPANETVKLDIEDGNYTLKVLNTVGQTIFAQNTEGSLSVNTANWTNGIYLFEVTNKATNKQQRSKIVVQH
jgi:hypothetical protein